MKLSPSDSAARSSAAAGPRIDAAQIRRVRSRLVHWFGGARRHFYWRERETSPFGVLLSEILLCRSRAESVDAVARRLLERFPDAASLARARVGDVERILYPLGLHRTRARLVVRCAREILERHAGDVPADVKSLMSLSYVGRYAAHSVACVAFGQHLPILDANVARVYQRLFDLPPLRVRVTEAKALWSLAKRVLPRAGAREFNWALLDLGGTTCKPRNPGCAVCPVSSMCGEFQRRRRSD